MKVIDPNATISGIGHLQVDLTNNNQLATLKVALASGTSFSISPESSFTFSLAFDSKRQGEVVLNLTAYGVTDQPLATGQGTCAINPGQA